MLDYVALGMIVCVGLLLLYGFIYIHDIPYRIAKKRNHPHMDAIHVGGWISLLTLHAIWPFLWIWATLYRSDRGYGFNQPNSQSNGYHERLSVLEREVASLRAELAGRGRSSGKGA